MQQPAFPLPTRTAHQHHSHPPSLHLVSSHCTPSDRRLRASPPTTLYQCRPQLHGRLPVVPSSLFLIRSPTIRLMTGSALPSTHICIRCLLLPLSWTCRPMQPLRLTPLLCHRMMPLTPPANTITTATHTFTLTQPRNLTRTTKRFTLTHTLTRRLLTCPLLQLLPSCPAGTSALCRPVSSHSHLLVVASCSVPPSHNSCSKRTSHCQSSSPHRASPPTAALPHWPWY